MAGFMAMVVASAVGLLLRGPLDGVLGVVPGEALGLVVAFAVYFFTRRWLAELRGE
jgi:EamA domain-containing membrane protein RarD